MIKIKKQYAIAVSATILFLTTASIFIYTYGSNRGNGKLKVGEKNPALEKVIISYFQDELFLDQSQEINVEKTRNDYQPKITLFDYDDKYAYVHQCAVELFIIQI